MSSKVKWGGIAGLVAAALLIISAILTQMQARLHRQLPLPRRRPRCLHRSNRCRAGHSRVAQRDASVRPIGDHRNGADHRRVRDHRCCDSDQHGAGTAHHSSTVRLAGAGAGARRLRASRCDHYPCPVAALVVRRTAHRGFPLGDFANALFGPPRICCWRCSGDLWALRCCLDVKEVAEPVLTHRAGPADLGGRLERWCENIR